MAELGLYRVRDAEYYLLFHILLPYNIIKHFSKIKSTLFELITFYRIC